MPLVQYRFKLPIKTPAQLRLYCEKALGLKIPNVKVCANHCTPWEAFCDAYFAWHPISIWKASRGLGGKSFLLAALGTVEAQTLSADVAILGGSGQQSANVKEYIGRFTRRESAPRFDDGQPLCDEPQTYEIKFARGNVVRALMASQTSVRGPHPQRLRLDELDEVAPDIFEASLGQSMDRDGVAAQTVLSSTEQYPDGTFSVAKKRGEDRGWGYFEWCFKETLEPHGWLTQANVDQQRIKMSDAAWKAEVLGQEPNPQDRAIFPEFVDRCFKSELGEYEDRDGEYLEFEAPVPEGEYAHGADWGKWRDFAVIATLRTDIYPARLVAFRRGRRRPWPILYGWLDYQIDRYGQSVSKRCHDRTGLGDVVHDHLKHDVEGVTLSGSVRDEVFNEWIMAVESMAVEAPRIKSMYNDHKFVSRDDLYGGGHPPDTFIAGGLAWKARNQNLVRVL